MNFEKVDRALRTTDEGDLIDDARVEIGLVGPIWSPIMRFRFYMSHQPDKHMTVWKLPWNWFHWLFGTYTPPIWFLKLINQVDK
jgi:hypothetical protein